MSWGRGDTIIEYGYDANGSLTSKTTTRGATVTETVAYEYNLQNRLAKVTTTKDPDTAPVVTTAEYRYDPSGIRVEKKDTDSAGRVETHYLIDPQNHTGYAQVLEETTDRYDASDVFIGADRLQYTLGDDVTGQTKSAWSGTDWTAAPTQYLLYDGHGSTRQLITQNQTLVDSYSYDGYGTMLGSTSGAEAAAGADTRYLYSGEQYDSALDQYYLRARYYNQSNGTFNRLDPYSGNLQDPQSLHKYLYCHANPVNGWDPTGREFTLKGMVVTAGITGLISSILVGSYGYAKGWSAGQIAKASGLAFLTGAAAGAIAYAAAAGIAAAAIGAGATTGEAAAAGWTAVGLIGGPSSIGLSLINLNKAMESGDDVDKTFAVVNMGLASFGFIASHWSAFNLAASATAAKIPQSTINYNAGRAVEDDFVTMLQANGIKVVGQRVRVETPFGKWREIDIVVKDPKTGLNYGIEVKSSIGAFNRNDAAARQQFSSDSWINQYGAKPIGQYAHLGRVEGTCRILWRPKSQ